MTPDRHSYGVPWKNGDTCALPFEIWMRQCVIATAGQMQFIERAALITAQSRVDEWARAWAWQSGLQGAQISTSAFPSPTDDGYPQISK
ncbi:hypothetical protein M5D96_005943 [Drosophila gunungcola]|uniref:Uncharacterized protein n=1 Tax=Drosophila gunungcola TaxID=103775 RepID=A0A9P9YRY4_9MUSC|nr:hypothetical protein M5D96_005943 [Drosophila gunungcola]